jgi:hypothetical protein
VLVRKANVRVGDDTSVMKVIWAGTMWEETMKEKYVSFLGFHCSELFACLDVSNTL